MDDPLEEMLSELTSLQQRAADLTNLLAHEEYWEAEFRNPPEDPEDPEAGGVREPRRPLPAPPGAGNACKPLVSAREYFTSLRSESAELVGVG